MPASARTRVFVGVGPWKSFGVHADVRWLRVFLLHQPWIVAVSTAAVTAPRSLDQGQWAVGRAAGSVLSHELESRASASRRAVVTDPGLRSVGKWKYKA